MVSASDVMFRDVWCLKGESLLSERRQIQIVGTQATSGCSKQEVQIRSQIAVTWEGKDARKERDKRNEIRNDDIWFAESDLNVVGFVTLRGSKRTVLLMFGMWHCITVLVSPDVSEERIAFLFKGWEVQDTPLKTMAWRSFE